MARSTSRHLMINTHQNQFTLLLKAEMLKALGCTEPIAVALCGAKAREVLGEMPKSVIVQCSNNIVKNVKGVIVPTTGDMRGIDTACMLGIIAGDSSLGLEVLQKVKETDIVKLKELLKTDICKVEKLKSDDNLHIICIVKGEKDEVEVEILHSHTNIVSVKKNGKKLVELDKKINNKNNVSADFLTFNNIYDFVNNFNIKDLQDLLDMEIECNNTIAEEGLKNKYGANVGKTILKNANGNVKEIVKAHASAGSDARMSGCNLPVVINSGSGNQGITILCGIYQYWKYLELPKEKLYRALCLANLLALWIKRQIGKLSAFCGAVSAGATVGTGITYLRDGTKKQIEDTIINALNSAGGIICDGAKSSCALKIALSVDCGIISSDMALNGNVFKNGEGLVKGNIEDTVDAVCKMAKSGMRETDEEILRLMLRK